MESQTLGDLMPAYEAELEAKNTPVAVRYVTRVGRKGKWAVVMQEFNAKRELIYSGEISWHGKLEIADKKAAKLNAADEAHVSKVWPA